MNSNNMLIENPSMSVSAFSRETRYRWLPPPRSAKSKLKIHGAEAGRRSKQVTDGAEKKRTKIGVRFPALSRYLEKSRVVLTSTS